jgi:two-component system sensor histidine kinase DesK
MIAETPIPARIPPAPPSRRREGLFMRYVWLIYSAFFFIQPVLKHSAREWTEFAAFYLAFLFCYIYPEFNRRAGIACIAGMFLLGVVYQPFNPGICGIFIFVTAFLPFIVTSAPVVLGAIAFVAAVICAEGLYLHMLPWIWASVAVASTVVGAVNLVQAREKRSSAKLLRAQEEIELLATVAERERIARDLHDLLGHTLSMITLKAELAGKLLKSEPNRAAIEIADVEQTARRALAEVREAVRGYRSQGFPAELAHAGQTLASAGIDLESDAPPAVLPAAEEAVLCMSVREAVTNIIRHSRARHCRITFVTAKDHILLVMKDDGVGGITKEGNGLRGMRERVEALRGQFAWESSAGRGVELRIELPLRAADGASFAVATKTPAARTALQPDSAT